MEIHTMDRYEDRLESRQHRKELNNRTSIKTNTRRSRVRLVRLPQYTMFFNGGIFIRKVRQAHQTTNAYTPKRCGI